MEKYIKFILIFIIFSVTVIFGLKVYPYLAGKSGFMHDKMPGNAVKTGVVSAISSAELDGLRGILLSCGGEEVFSYNNKRNNWTASISVKNADKNRLVDYYTESLVKAGWSFEPSMSSAMEKAGGEKEPGIRTLMFRGKNNSTLHLGIYDDPEGCRVVPVLSVTNMKRQ